MTNVRIEGPATVAPGASASYRFLATRSDGTTVDVTSQSTWHSSNTSVLSIESPGTVRAKGRGEASLNAFNSGLQPIQFRSWLVSVFVLEDGTFRVKGRVQESGAGLPGARVEVVSGTGTGLIATTGSSGSYALYGLAGEVRIDATLDGFDRESRTIAVTDNMTVDIGMRPTTTPTDFNGTWTITLTASAGCVPRFPEDASSRSYSATVSQTGTALKLDLIAPRVASSRMNGIVLDQSLTLFLPTDESYYPFYRIRSYSLVEALAPAGFLAIAGTARGQRNGDSVIGTLDGEFAIYASANGSAVWQRQMSCQRDDHGFRLDRN
ncbi:MAG: carboxypeptidase regulatory-like domain-containing protein [Acidobacteriota bacterium]